MNEKHQEPEFEYTWDEFVCDFDAWVFAGTQAPSTDYTPKSHFAGRYPDSREARYKLRRFAAAVLYLQRHASSPAFAEFVVLGEKKGLFSVPLVDALWHYFHSIPENYLKSDPPVERMARLARGEEF